MKNIIIIDITNHFNYIDIMKRPIGASEYQIQNLIRELSKKFKITCINHIGTQIDIDNVSYYPIKNINNFVFDKDDIIMFQRFFTIDENLIEKIKNNKIYIWCHDLFNLNVLLSGNVDKIKFFSNEKDLFIKYLEKDIIKNLKFIFVSNYNKELYINFIKKYNIEPNYDNLFTIYNILYENDFIKIKNMDLSLDKKMIVYASAWQKGIGKIINVFEYINNQDNGYKLILLSPGYDNQYVNHMTPIIKDKFKDNVIILGPQNKEEYSKIIKSSLCTLTTTFAETFGCVFAESYYLGTPVIADYRSGAVKEIIDNNFIVNMDHPQTVYEKILYLEKNRDNLNIKLDDKFMLDYNIELWNNLFS